MTIPSITSIGIPTIGSLEERSDADFLTLSEVAHPEGAGQHASLVAPAGHRTPVLQDRTTSRHHRR